MSGNCPNCGPRSERCSRCGVYTEIGVFYQGVPLCEKCIEKMEEESDK